METWENDADQAAANEVLALNAEIKNFLAEAAKWARFMGIVGYVMIGLLIVGALSAGAFLNFFSNAAGQNAEEPANTAMFSVIMGAYLLLIALLYFFPTRYLHQFGVKTQLALRNNEAFNFTEAFAKLKSFFKFFGILTIVLLAFYGLALVVMILFGSLGINAGQGM